jgi:hypothetical protein
MDRVGLGKDYNYKREVEKLWGYGFGFLLFGL